MTQQTVSQPDRTDVHVATMTIGGRQVPGADGASEVISPSTGQVVGLLPEASAADDVLNLALSSPFGEAHFEAPLSATAEFLRSTYGIIPAGSEGDFIDFDSELEELLWQA